MKVKIINHSNYALPEYQTSQSAGLDIRANINESITIKPLERAIIPTGIYLELPDGCEMQIRPRSGLAAKYGITVLNTPGTIDADYRGEIKVILANISNEPAVIYPGDRIAQMVMARYEQIEWLPSVTLTDTERGAGGLGSTGK